MFHTYVLTSAKDPVRGGLRSVDFDRATWLMDKDILRAAEVAMEGEMRECPREDADYGPQWLWDWYCDKHFEKYRESFVPNVDPHWDQ